MILYHFTYPKHLDAIFCDGLKPADGAASDSEHKGAAALMTGGEPVVWLAAKPSLALSRRRLLGVAEHSRTLASRGRDHHGSTTH